MRVFRTHIIGCMLLLTSVAAMGESHLASELGSYGEARRLQSDSLTSDEARQIALNVVENFIDLSLLQGPMGEDLGPEFTYLFTLNGSLPLDYIGEGTHEYVSPESYVSEYVAAGIAVPLAVRTELLPDYTTVNEVGGSDNFSVTIHVKRTSLMTFVDGVYMQLATPRTETWKLVVIAYGYGGARIDQVIHVKVPTISPWALDLGYGFNVANADFTSNGSEVKGLDQMKLKSHTIGLAVNYRFAPFQSPISEDPISYYFKVGAGVDFTSYSSPAVKLSSQTPDYLLDDQVLALLSGDLLNDFPASEDFILYIEDDFDEERLNVTTIDLMVGGGYQLSEHTAIELGLGLIGKGSGDIAVRSDYGKYTAFQEGYFEDGAVIIAPGTATYEDYSLEFVDPSDVYHLRSGAKSYGYMVKTSSSAYLDLRLIQMFDVGDFALGGTLSMRTLFNSPVTREAGASGTISEVAVDGIPRIISFTERFNPFYIGFGIRIQKR